MIWPLIATWAFMVTAALFLWRGGVRTLLPTPLAVALLAIPAAAVFELFVGRIVDTRDGEKLVSFAIAAGFATALASFSLFVLAAIKSTDKSS